MIRRTRARQQGRSALPAFAALLFLVFIGCEPSDPFPNVIPMGPEARALVRTNCAVCHGERGDGQGPSAPTLGARPRDWTDMSWQTSVSDEDIARIIVQGGLAVGRSGSMPAFSHLKDSPELALYVNAVRAFAVFPEN